MKKIFIKTYGCQANIADSETIAGILNKEYEIVNSIEEADIIIINSCSVKNKTQSSILEYIKRIPEDKIIIVGGCLVNSIDIKKKFKKVKAVFDTNSITKINKIIEKLEDSFNGKKEERINIPVVRKDKNIGIIVIEQGCNSYCTFCATKSARGGLKSYKIDEIKKAVENAVKEGCQLIYLTGQDTGAYGIDIKTDLTKLLEELVKIEGDFLMRVGMMNPWHAKKILERLIKIYKNPKIIKFLHIPIQSGSDKVLKKMKRTHTVEDFKMIVNRFRKEISGINISTDIIVGYPEETEEDFEETIKLIKEIKPEVVNISMFSSRAGTEAAKLKQLSSQVIKKRSSELTKVYKGYAKVERK